MKQSHQYSPPAAWVEIDLSAVRHNFLEIRRLARAQLEPRMVPEVDMLSVVKADSYGHGMNEIARVIERAGGRFFAVSNIDEALDLRRSGNKHPILIFETTFPAMAGTIVEHDLTASVCTLEMARALDRAARRKGGRSSVHIKVDTGMSRLGVLHTDAVGMVKRIAGLKNLCIEGIFTHFPVADTDQAFTERQIAVFSDVVAELIKEGISFRYLHAANSMGIGGYKNRFFNLARPGVMLYGLYPGDALRDKLALKPVMTVKTRVLFVKTIRRGSGISYGHTFRALSDIPVAVLGIGYSDGFRRSFSNTAHVLINGLPCPVLGRVTMDQTIVDISLALRGGKIRIGDEAVVLGDQKGSVITADDLAQWAGTIHYEITCNLGNRLPRIYRRTKK